MSDLQQQLNDILAGYRATEYVTDTNGTVGIIDNYDQTSVWYRIIRGRYYFDGRVPLSYYHKKENFRHAHHTSDIQTGN
jgi:hypothetical protein